MNTANLNTLIQRYEDNFEWINNAEHDEIFKWRAVRCFQESQKMKWISSCPVLTPEKGGIKKESL